ncbi:MAG TPA: hypothetical protein VGO00_21630 [Kofleriaceae bacterium]|jgi:hypothetical protein|nr:hypothetical protein [Kofleriaceae bacterium]
MRITVAAALLIVGCATHDTMPPLLGYGGYGSMPAQMSVSEPSPYTVESMPPDPLYEQMSASPGPGWVWIDGYWHWGGAEWVWVPGRWEHQQEGYVYVEPDYDYAGDHYIYTPGYWALPGRIPHGWGLVRDHRTGRPPTATPPVHQGGRGTVTGVRSPGPTHVGVPVPPGTQTTGGGVPIRPTRPVYVPRPQEPTWTRPAPRAPVAVEPVAPQEPIYAPPAPTAPAPTSPPPQQQPTVIYVPRPAGPPPVSAPHGTMRPGPTTTAPVEPVHEAPGARTTRAPTTTTTTTVKHH